MEGILLDCVGDKLESGSEYRFIRSEDILNSHLKICSSISVPRRSSHRGDNDEDDNNEDDLLMDACSDQKGSGLVICLTRIQRHVSLSLSLSRPVHGLCWYCHVLRPCLWIWLLLCGVSFVFGLIFSWPVFMQRICNLSDNKKSGVSLLSRFSVSSPVRGFYFVFVSLWFPKANFVAKLQP